MKHNLQSGWETQYTFFKDIKRIHWDGRDAYEAETDRGFSCGLWEVFLLRNVWSSENTGTSALRETQKTQPADIRHKRTSRRFFPSLFRPTLPSMAFWRIMWSKNLVLLAYIPPQPGQATTFSCVWLRRCSRSLGRPLAVASQSGKIAMHAENSFFFFYSQACICILLSILTWMYTFPSTAYGELPFTGRYFYRQRVHFNMPVEPLWVFIWSLLWQKWTEHKYYYGWQIITKH